MLATGEKAVFQLPSSQDADGGFIQDVGLARLAGGYLDTRSCLQILTCTQACSLVVLQVSASTFVPSALPLNKRGCGICADFARLFHIGRVESSLLVSSKGSKKGQVEKGELL